MVENVNEPAIQFNKSQLNHKFLNELFINQEVERNNWAMKVIKEMESCSNERLMELVTNENIKLNEYVIQKYLSFFTKNDANIEEIDEYMQKVVANSNGYLNYAYVDDENFIVDGISGSIAAQRLTDINPSYAFLFPSIGTADSLGYCHQWALTIARYYANDKHQVRIATGNVAPFSDKAKYLHSWVEINVDGKELVLDPTMNLVVNKSGYYLFNNINGPIHKIPRNTILRDFDKIQELDSIDWLLVKVYLTNRNAALTFLDEYSSNKEEVLQRYQPQ